MRSAPFYIIWQSATGERQAESDNAGDALKFYRQHRQDTDKLDMVIETKEGKRLSEADLERLAGQG